MSSCGSRRRQERPHPPSPGPGAGDERVGAKEAQRHCQQRRQHRLRDDELPVAVEGGGDAQRPAARQEDQQSQTGEAETAERAGQAGEERQADITTGDGTRIRDAEWAFARGTIRYSAGTAASQQLDGVC